jgi:hypothetical protein
MPRATSRAPSRRRRLNPDELLTTSEALVYARMSKRTLERLVVKGWLHPIRRGRGRTRFWDPAELDDLWELQTG